MQLAGLVSGCRRSDRRRGHARRGGDDDGGAIHRRLRRRRRPEPGRGCSPSTTSSRRWRVGPTSTRRPWPTGWRNRPTPSPRRHVDDAVAWLMETGYRHIPVYGDGELLGIVTIRDLMWALGTRRSSPEWRRNLIGTRPGPSGRGGCRDFSSPTSIWSTCSAASAQLTVDLLHLGGQLGVQLCHGIATATARPARRLRAASRSRVGAAASCRLAGSAGRLALPVRKSMSVSAPPITSSWRAPTRGLQLADPHGSAFSSRFRRRRFGVVLVPQLGGLLVGPVLGGGVASGGELLGGLAWPPVQLELGVAQAPPGSGCGTGARPVRSRPAGIERLGVERAAGIGRWRRRVRPRRGRGRRSRHCRAVVTSASSVTGTTASHSSCSTMSPLVSS